METFFHVYYYEVSNKLIRVSFQPGRDSEDGDSEWWRDTANSNEGLYGSSRSKFDPYLLVWYDILRYKWTGGSAS